MKTFDSVLGLILGLHWLLWKATAIVAFLIF